VIFARRHFYAFLCIQCHFAANHVHSFGCMWELIHFFAFFYISLHMVMLHSLSTAYIFILKHLHSFPQAAFLYAAFYIFALCSAACICIHSSFDISCIAPSLHLAAFTQPATFTCIVMHSPKYTFWCIEGANCIPLHFASFIKCCMHEHLYFDACAPLFCLMWIFTQYI